MADDKDLQWWLRRAPELNWTPAPTGDGRGHVVSGPKSGLSQAEHARASAVIRGFGRWVRLGQGVYCLIHQDHYVYWMKPSGTRINRRLVLSAPVDLIEDLQARLASMEQSTLRDLWAARGGIVQSEELAGCRYRLWADHAGLPVGASLDFDDACDGHYDLHIDQWLEYTSTLLGVTDLAEVPAALSHLLPFHDGNLQFENQLVQMEIEFEQSVVHLGAEIDREI